MTATSTCVVCDGPLLSEHGLTDHPGVAFDCRRCGYYELESGLLQYLRTVRSFPLANQTSLLQLLQGLQRAIDEKRVRRERPYFHSDNWKAEARRMLDLPGDHGPWLTAKVSQADVADNAILDLQWKFDEACRAARRRARVAVFHARTPDSDGSLALFFTPACAVLRDRDWFRALEVDDTHAPAAADVEICAGDDRARELLR